MRIIASAVFAISSLSLLAGDLPSLMSEEALLYVNPSITNVLDNTVETEYTWDGTTTKSLRWFRKTASGVVADISAAIERVFWTGPSFYLYEGKDSKARVITSKDEIIKNLYYTPDTDWYHPFDGFKDEHAIMTNAGFVASNVYGRITPALRDLVLRTRDKLDEQKLDYSTTRSGFSSQSTELQGFGFCDDPTLTQDHRTVWPQFSQFEPDRINPWPGSLGRERRGNALESFYSVAFGASEKHGNKPWGDVLAFGGNRMITNRIESVFETTSLSNALSRYPEDVARHGRRLDYNLLSLIAQSISMCDRMQDTVYPNDQEYFSYDRVGEMRLLKVFHEVPLTYSGSYSGTPSPDNPDGWAYAYKFDESSIRVEPSEFERSIRIVGTNVVDRIEARIGPSETKDSTSATFSSGAYVRYLITPNMYANFDEGKIYIGVPVAEYDHTSRAPVTRDYISDDKGAFLFEVVTEREIQGELTAEVIVSFESSTPSSIPGFKRPERDPFAHDASRGEGLNAFETKWLTMFNLRMIKEVLMYDAIKMSEEKGDDYSTLYAMIGPRGGVNTYPSFKGTYFELQEEAIGMVSERLDGICRDFPYFNNTSGVNPEDVVRQDAGLASELVGTSQQLETMNHKIRRTGETLYISFGPDEHGQDDWRPIGSGGAAVATWSLASGAGNNRSVGDEISLGASETLGIDVYINFSNLRKSEK